MSINAALVGFGAIARHGHLPWYLKQQSVKLAGVVEPTPLGRSLARELMPDTAVFASLDDLLKSQEVSFVDITTQPAVHSELIIRAAKMGVHVMCEKPFVNSLKSLNEIETVRRVSRATIACCHNWYHAPAIRKGLNLLAAGVVGQPEKICFSARRPQSARGAEHWRPAWRESASEGGGILGDLGYHGFYLASRIFAGPPILVSAKPIHGVSTNGGAEDAVSVDLDYGGARRARFTLSWRSPVRETRLEIYGSGGCVIIEGDTLRVKANGNHDFEERFESLTADSCHAGWIGDTLTWFLSEIGNGNDDAIWQEIRWSVSTLDSAYVSLRSGETVANLIQQSCASIY